MSSPQEANIAHISLANAMTTDSFGKSRAKIIRLNTQLGESYAADRYLEYAYTGEYPVSVQVMGVGCTQTPSNKRQNLSANLWRIHSSGENDTQG